MIKAGGLMSAAEHMGGWPTGYLFLFSEVNYYRSNSSVAVSAGTRKSHGT